MNWMRNTPVKRRTYKELRNLFDKYTVFCGQNPLVLSPNVNDSHTTPSKRPPQHSQPLRLHQLTSEKLKGIHSDVSTSLQNVEGLHHLTPVGARGIPELEEPPSHDRKSDTPTLPQLLLIRQKRVKVIETVAPDWKHVAIALGFNEPKIRTIEMGTFHQPQDACIQMFSDWLEGGHGLREPITWATLMECLIEAGLVDLAEELEDIFQ